MQRSSESIGTIAAALAKAQGELVNPEKSLVATIRSDGPGAAERSFRYAPLSSGLDIVRKTLSHHEIATVQTTSIDQSAGIVNLTTVLAHASGEWIASDWPVCAISETAAPRRMGAALTYARRYALFTLVGIAGEDDVDAPDLTAPPDHTAGIEKPPPSKTGQLNGGRSHIRHRRAPKSVPRPILGAAPSAALRDRLVGELKDIASGDDAAPWAHRILSDKNSLTDADARLLEDAFEARLTALEGAAGLGDAALSLAASAPQPTSSVELRTQEPARRASNARAVDKSQLVHPEPRRFRDKEHVKFVAKQPCLVCGRRPSDAHHLRFAQHRALGRKVSDEFTVPLCRGHHREVHGCGDEATWWQKASIDPTVPARALWLVSHPLPMASGKTGHQGTTTLPAVSIGASKRDRRTSTGVQKTKQSQLLRLVFNDFLQADRGQPAQCAQKHWSGYQRRQAALSLQCRSPWPYRRDGDRRAGGCGRLQGIRSGYHCGLRRPIGRGAGVGFTVSESAVATATRHDNGNRIVRNPSRSFARVQTSPPNQTKVAGYYLCRVRARRFCRCRPRSSIARHYKRNASLAQRGAAMR